VVCHTLRRRSGRRLGTRALEQGPGRAEGEPLLFNPQQFLDRMAAHGDRLAELLDPQAATPLPS
jgi:hypothetical protein